MLNTSCIFLQVNPLFGTIYNSIYLVAKSIHNVRKAGELLSGVNLAYFTKNTNFTGFNQRIMVDAAGDVLTKYVILDSHGIGSQLYQTFLLDLKSRVLSFAGNIIHFPGGYPPPSDSSCWFDKNVLCTGGKGLRFGMCVYSCEWRMDVWFIKPFTVASTPCFSPNIKLPVVIPRCGGHLHHSGVCCHLVYGCWRAPYWSLHQVQPVDRYRFFF